MIGRIEIIKSHIPDYAQAVAHSWLGTALWIIGTVLVFYFWYDNRRREFEQLTTWGAKWEWAWRKHRVVVFLIVIFMIVIVVFCITKREKSYISPASSGGTIAVSSVPPLVPTDNNKITERTTRRSSPTIAKKDVAPKVEISGDNNVTSLYQSGGIIAGTYINLADSPRRLKPEQIVELQIASRNACPALQNITVTAANSNQEAQVYALDFVKIFKASGCKSDLALPIPGLTPDVSGIHIVIRDLQKIPPGAEILANILSKGGIQFKVNPAKPEFFPEESFVLVVGAKQ